MKTKLLVVSAALVGAATLSAHAGIFFSVRLPFPPFPVPVIAVTPPAPVVVAAPAPPVVCAPVVTVVTPPCPGPDYVWVPGYYSGYGPARVWVAGCWRYNTPHYVYDRDDVRYRHYDYDNHNEHFDGRNGYDGHFDGGHRR